MIFRVVIKKQEVLPFLITLKIKNDYAKPCVVSGLIADL